MYSVIYNGKAETDAHLLVVQRPNIPAPARRFETVQIPAVDGNLYIDGHAVEDIEITIDFNFMGAPDAWLENFRAAKKWLYSDGDGKLRLGDDPGYFYKVKNVQIDQSERVCYEIGRFSATFVCNGYTYLASGETECGMEDARYNPYETAKPLYIIKGSGAGKLTVNGHVMSVDVTEALFIDTDRKIAYRQDKGLTGASVQGDYDGLVLVPGENSISISEGLTLSVVPNWRCL